MIPDTDLAGLYTSPSFVIPDGYWITSLVLKFHTESPTDHDAKWRVLGSSMPEIQAKQGDWGVNLPFGGDLAHPGNGGLLLHESGSNTVSFRVEDNRQTWFSLTAKIAPTDAAQGQYFALQQEVSNKIAAVESQLEGVDTLTFRREESTEIMKGVLRFLLGPDFEFMPTAVLKAIIGSGADILHGVGFTGNDLGLSPADWAIVNQHEDLIAFVNQAIEWENVVSFLYPYFWDVPTSWEFIRDLRHPDATRQAFLRAGSARVVLTIRKGWEESWIRFTQGGFRGAEIPADHPYLTLAQEIAAYDSTNYPGIPAANPGGGATGLADAVHTVSSSVLVPSDGEQDVVVADTTGFVAGRQGIDEAPVRAFDRDRHRLGLTEAAQPAGQVREPVRGMGDGERGGLLPVLVENAHAVALRGPVDPDVVGRFADRQRQQDSFHRWQRRDSADEAGSRVVTNRRSTALLPVAGPRPRREPGAAVSSRPSKGDHHEPSPGSRRVPTATLSSGPAGRIVA